MKSWIWFARVDEMEMALRLRWVEGGRREEEENGRKAEPWKSGLLKRSDEDPSGGEGRSWVRGKKWEVDVGSYVFSEQ